MLKTFKCLAIQWTHFQVLRQTFKVSVMLHVSYAHVDPFPGKLDVMLKTLFFTVFHEEARDHEGY